MSPKKFKKSAQHLPAPADKKVIYTALRLAQMRSV
jgi:hypothetical protein